MLKRIFAVIVMIFSVIGAIFCVVGILGAWVAPVPIKAITDGALDAGNSYVAVAGQAAQNASTRLAAARSEIEDAQQRLQNVTPEQRDAVRQQMRTAAQQRFGPSVTAVRSTATEISAGLIRLNTSLESFNRIPGVNVPTLTDELQAISQRLDTLNERLENFNQAMSATQFDGARLDAAAMQVTTEMQSVEDRLNQWQSRFTNLSAALENAKGAIANALTMMSIASTLFFGLFLAGQISLFSHALGWFRKPRTI
jgi:chromosome segregation ATPase